ncbi:hypothetical protein O6H91_23G036200 [Diphasiastrum complanatum]|nr:hypothetical protein O6H91_23G036200 [Diphasiastrum complanatum]
MCSSHLSDELGEQAPAVKKICGLQVQNLSVSSILEDASEANESFDQNELDEAQEKLLYGVMRSLEEELGASDLTSTSAPDAEGQAVNSLSFPTVLEESCLAEEYSLQGEVEPSTSSDGEVENFELTFLLDAIDDFNKSSILTKLGTLVSEETDGVGTGEDSTAELQSENWSDNCKRINIGYLLEASDDELGIIPSPGSESVSSESELFSGSLQGTDTTGSNNDSVNVEPWFTGWDCSSEAFLELAHDGEFTNQEWLKRAMSSLEMVVDESEETPSLERSSTFLEPAGSSH